MKVGPLLIAGLAASTLWAAAGCGAMNRLLGREPSMNQWLQQNQARIFQEEDVPEPAVQPFTHFAAGQLLEGKQQIHQAIIQYRKALDLNPKFIGAYNRLAICLDKIGQHTEAESALRRAIKVDPKLAYLRNNLAFSLMAQRRWHDSERELRVALQLKPDYQRARVNLGIVMSKLAKRDEAFQQFQMVLGDARAHYNMGLLDKAGGRYAQAAESFRNAIALEPDLQAAKIQLDKLRTMALITPRELQRQADYVAPSHSVVATSVPLRRPPPVHTIRVAAAKRQDQNIVAAKLPATSLPSEAHKQDNAVVEQEAAAQAEPDISGMSIGRSEDPFFADEIEDNGADFSWEVVDASATAQRAASDSAVIAQPLARARGSDGDSAIRNPQSAIRNPSLPFFTYEEPCEVRNIGRFAARPRPRSSPCAEDELVDQFVLGESGFDLAPNLTTSVPQPALAANTEEASGYRLQATGASPEARSPEPGAFRGMDGHDAAARDKSNAWTLDEWRRFARGHHLATDGSNLPSVLMRLQGNLAKKWHPPHRPTGNSSPTPTMPNPAAEIEWSATRVP